MIRKYCMLNANYIKRMWSVLLLNRIDIKYQNSWQQVDKQTKQCKMDDDTIDATFFNAVTVVMLCEPCNTDNQTNKDTTHDVNFFINICLS